MENVETPNKKCDFTLDHYRHCLELALKKGYSFMTMEQFAEQPKNSLKDKKIIVLRHDIDHNIGLAENISGIEHELGIKSTYFIRLHSKNYNPCSLANYSIIKALILRGHEIGLHYDAGFAEFFNENAEHSLLRDKTIFENIINQKFSGISTHEPRRTGFVLSKSIIEKLGLKYDAYSDTFMKGMKYISDSSAVWREGCMCSFIEKETPLLCILTHPFWWFNKSSLENY